MLKDSHRSPEAYKAAIVTVNLRLSVSVATATVAATAVATITKMKAMSISMSILGSYDPNSIITMSIASDDQHEERDPSYLDIHIEQDALVLILKLRRTFFYTEFLFSEEQKPDPL